MSQAMTMFRLLVLALLTFEHCTGYSALEDERIIAKYKEYLRVAKHALVARQLVHNANWSPMGTISTNEIIANYPMVNVVSIDDSALNGTSTGKIHFLLTNLDFSGIDWHHNNKVTFLFTDEQNLKCKKRGEDPMDPTCARAIISGKVNELAPSSPNYNDWLDAFMKRHPAAKDWVKEHTFYFCELEIQHIFVLDYYGGAHEITAEDYYRAQPDEKYLTIQ